MSNLIPKWQNLRADGSFWAHGRTLEDFLTLVIEPSLAELDGRAATLRASDDVAAAFVLSDLEVLREETLRAYALSVQATWERQLRGWLAACAAEVGAPDPADVHTANWKRLQAIFRELRGLSMDGFAGKAALDLLQLVGNTCRHGDGASCRALKARRPDLWPDPFRPNANGLAVDLALLRAFVAAIAEFWTDADEIHANSLQAKHPSVVRRLAQAEVRWRDRARQA